MNPRDFDDFPDFGEFQKVFKDTRRFAVKVLIAWLAFWVFVIAAIVFAVVKVFA